MSDYEEAPEILLRAQWSAAWREMLRMYQIDGDIDPRLVPSITALLALQWTLRHPEQARAWMLIHDAHAVLNGATQEEIDANSEEVTGIISECLRLVSRTEPDGEPA